MARGEVGSTLISRNGSLVRVGHCGASLARVIPIELLREGTLNIARRFNASSETDQAAANSPDSGRKPEALGRADAIAIGVLLLLVTVVAWVRLWYRPGLGDWDIMTFYLPWYGFLGDHVRNLDVPGWNPHIFSGAPFAGNPQSGWGYAPAMALFAIFPAITAYKLFIAFHFALGGVAAYGYARLLRVGPLGALAGGIVFSLGQNVGAADCCTNHLQLVNWLPVALFGIELAQWTGRWSDRMPALALAAVAVSQMIAGWLGQGAYNGGLVVGSYLVFRMVLIPPVRGSDWRRRVRACVVDGAVIAGLGVGLAAASLLPRLDVVRRTFVGSEEYQGSNFTDDRGWGWWTILRVTAGYRPEWHPYYLGGAALACAILALLAWRRFPVVLYFAALVAVILILPLRPTPVHELLYLLPRFRGLHLHDPGRVLAFLPVGISVLVAIGVETLPGYLRRRWGILLAVVPLAVWVYLKAEAWGKQPIAGVTTFALFSTLAVLALVATVLRTGRERRFLLPGRVTAILLIGIIFVDPTGFALVKPMSGPRDEDSVRARAADIPDSVMRAAIVENAAREDPGGAGESFQTRQEDGELFRYFGYVQPRGKDWQEHEIYMDADVLPLLTNARSIRLGLQEIQGYDPAHLDRYRHFFAALNGLERDYHEELVYPSGITSPLLNLLNTRYIIIPRDYPAGRLPFDLIALRARYPEVYQNDEIRILENSDALPRAWMVHDVEVTEPEEALELLADGRVDPRQTALLEVTPPELNPPPAGSEDRVNVTAYEDERVELTVEAASDGLLVLSEVYDPGWRVYVDGERSEVYAADYLLRGVAVPAGSHVVEFRYEPASLRIGVMISLGALAVLAAIAGWFLVGRARLSGRNASATTGGRTA